MAMIGPKKGTVNNPRGINQWTKGGGPRGAKTAGKPSVIRGPMDIGTPSFAGKPARIGGVRAGVSGAAARVKMGAKSVGGSIKSGASKVASKARGADVPGLKIRSRIAGANSKRKSMNYATGTTARGRMAARIKSGAAKVGRKVRGADVPGLKIRSRIAGARAKNKAKNYATNTTARSRIAARIKSGAAKIGRKVRGADVPGLKIRSRLASANAKRKSMNYATGTTARSRAMSRVKGAAANAKSKISSRLAKFQERRGQKKRLRGIMKSLRTDQIV